MKKVPDAIINEIRLLRRGGSSFKEIARKLGLGSSTTYKYGARCKISEAGIQKLRDKVTTQRLEFVKKFAVPRPVKFPKSFSDRLVRIIAHCFFDGSVSSSSVNYTNSSVHLVNQFINDIREVFHIEPSLIRFYRGKFTLYCQVYFSYTMLSRYMYTHTPSYSTSAPNARIPKQIFADFNLASEFLQAFWEDEGTIKSNGDITAKTKSLNMARQLVELHNAVGIKTNVYYDKANDAYEIYVIRNPTNMLAFKTAAGFRYSVVTRGRYRGMKKEDLFQFMQRGANGKKLNLNIPSLIWARGQVG